MRGNLDDQRLRSEGVLSQLRGLVPERSLAFIEALKIAELQAATLRRLSGRLEEGISEDVVAALPRFRVVRRKLPTSGLSYWDGARWVIAINGAEPLTRQRFTLLHEFKHVLDHGRTTRLYGDVLPDSEQRAEQACDYFAGCVLMPKALVKRAWGNGLQRPAALAQHFDVSERAIEVRLAQLGLCDTVSRCLPSVAAPPTAIRRRGYRRSLSLRWVAGPLTGAAA